MRSIFIAIALLCALAVTSYAVIQHDVINRDTGASVGGTTDDDLIEFDDAGSNFTATKIGPAIEELATVNPSGPNAGDAKVDYSQLGNVPAFSVPSGTNPVIDGSGDLAIDTTGGQIVYYDGSGTSVLSPDESKCIVVENLAAADDDMPIFSSPAAITIGSIWCQYAGSAPTTAAALTLEDGAGNAMTITGANPACTGPGTNPTPAAVTAGNTLAAYEMLRFDVTNTPDPETDTYMICVGYTIDRQ
jgi:hypothetical protein